MSSDFKKLAKALTEIKDPKVMEAFLKDLLTPAEIRDITERVEIIKLLMEHIPQRTIARKLGVSIAKVTRGSRELQFGHNGFTHVMKAWYPPASEPLARRW